MVHLPSFHHPLFILLVLSSGFAFSVLSTFRYLAIRFSLFWFCPSLFSNYQTLYHHHFYPPLSMDCTTIHFLGHISTPLPLLVMRMSLSPIVAFTSHLWYLRISGPVILSSLSCQFYLNQKIGHIVICIVNAPKCSESDYVSGFSFGCEPHQRFTGACSYVPIPICYPNFIFSSSRKEPIRPFVKAPVLPSVAASPRFIPLAITSGPFCYRALRHRPHDFSALSPMCIENQAKFPEASSSA